MAENDNEEENEETTPSDLRKQLAKEKKARKELEDQVAQFLTQSRSKTVEDFLTSKKLPAKVAKLVPSDLDASAEALESWLDEYKDVLGLQPASEDDQAEDTIDEATKTAHARIAAAGESSLPTGKAADLESKIASFTTTEEMQAWLRNGATL